MGFDLNVMVFEPHRILLLVHHPLPQPSSSCYFNSPAL